MGGGPLGRGHVLELPVGVLQPLQDGQLFELDALVALQFRLLGPVLHRDQPVYDLPEQYRQGQAGQTRGDRDDEGRGPFPARLLLLPAVPPIRPGIHLGRPDRRRDDRRQERRPPHRTAEHRLHGRGARRNQRRSTATPSIRISSSSSRSCGTSPRSFRRTLRRFPPSTPRRGRAAPRRAPRWRCVRACCSTPPRRFSTAPISTRAR